MMTGRKSFKHRISGCYSAIRQYHERQRAGDRAAMVMFAATILMMGFSATIFFKEPSKPANYIMAQTQHLNILSNHNLHIQEVVQARYETPGIYTGIARQMPKKYEMDGKIKYRRLDIPHQVLEPHSFEPSGNRIHIVKEAPFSEPGTHEYQLSYVVQNEINIKQNGQAELKWNITGDNRTLPIDVIYFTVNLPEGLDPEKVEAKLYLKDYTGRENRWEPGTHSYLMERHPGRIRFATRRTLKPEETLLAHLSWFPESRIK